MVLESGRRRGLLQSLGLGGIAGIAGCSSTLLSRGPELRVPESSQIGDPFPITVAGVEPGATVEVTATDRHERTFTREYDVGDKETVTSPRMLFHHLEQVDSEGPPVFLAPTDERVEVSVAVYRDGETRASATAQREYVNPDVAGEYIEREERNFGAFYPPSGDTQGPGVLTLHGAGGLVRRTMSKLLASRGYSTLALNHKGLGGHRWVRTPVEYFLEAVEWLRDRPEVTDGQVGVVGHSQGSDAALLTGIHSSAVGAVVTYDAGPTTTGVYHPDNRMPGPAFTLDGEPYRDHGEFAAFWEAMLAEMKSRGGVEGCDIECYEEAYAALDSETQAKNTFRVEEIGGPVSFLNSETSPHTRFWVGPESIATQFAENEWNQRRLTVTAMIRLRQQGHEYPSEHVVFEDAMHGFGASSPYDTRAPPSRLRTAAERRQPQLDKPVLNTYRARNLAWPHVLGTLAEGIGDPSAENG